MRHKCYNLHTPVSTLQIHLVQDDVSALQEQHTVGRMLAHQWCRMSATSIDMSHSQKASIHSGNEINEHGPTLSTQYSVHCLLPHTML